MTRFTQEEISSVLFVILVKIRFNIFVVRELFFEIVVNLFELFTVVMSIELCLFFFTLLAYPLVSALLFVRFLLFLLEIRDDLSILGVHEIMISVSF